MQKEITYLSELKVLLVESSPTQAKIISHQLQELTISSIRTAYSGQQALEIMQNNSPDLVISSFYLSDQTGTELVTRMRTDKQLSDTPYMLISSETSVKMLDPIRQAGAVAILPKPFNPDDLKTALRTTLDFINLDSAGTNEIIMAKLNVLLVDDSKLARKHLCRVLNKLGMENIDEAINGKDAVEKLSNNFYDLIVTDYHMPEMDGQELIRYIREKSSQSSVPVLMVTSEHDENRLAAIQQAGVSGICNKPFEPETLKLYLNKLLTN